MYVVVCVFAEFFFFFLKLDCDTDCVYAAWKLMCYKMFSNYGKQVLH